MTLLGQPVDQGGGAVSWEAADLVNSRFHPRGLVRLGGTGYRQLAQALPASGDTTRAEVTIREVLKRDVNDVEAQRLLYRGLKVPDARPKPTRR